MSQNVSKCPLQTHRCPKGFVLYREKIVTLWKLRERVKHVAHSVVRDIKVAAKYLCVCRWKLIQGYLLASLRFEDAQDVVCEPLHLHGERE